MANKCSTEASRAKHKFAVKRNSWPKTRGVAMNPVDHVRTPLGKPKPLFIEMSMIPDIYLYSLTVVVTTSTLVRPRPCRGTPPAVKRPVLLLPGEPVCSVVPRRRRTKGDDGNGWSYFSLCDGLKILFFCYETYVPRRLREKKIPCKHTHVLSKSRLWTTRPKKNVRHFLMTII